jgi:uncharacterized protein (TIGR00162 family)
MVTKVKFLKKKKFRNGVLFTGLPGIGLVGKICVDYMLKQMKAEKVAEITSDSFPPSVHTSEGIMELIKDEIYSVSQSGRDYIFLAGPVQPSLDLRGGSTGEHFEFATAIVDALKERGLKEVCALAGINIGERRMTSTPRVVAAATSKRLLSSWSKLGAIVDKPEGLITGAAGLIPVFASDKGIESACLMGETNAKLIYGDHGAAKKVLELIIKRFKLKIKMTGIEQEAKDIEKAFSELSKQLSEQPSAEPAEKLSYVR